MGIFSASIFRVGNWKFYFLVAILFRGMLLFYFSHSFKAVDPGKIQSGFIVMQNDYNYHLKPVDNYMNKGVYSYDGQTRFSGRMPGYSFPYLVLRYVLSESAGLIVLILLQFFLSCLSVYVLALSAYYMFKNERIFYVAYSLFLLSTFTSVFDLHTLAESFAVSAFVFSIYFLISYREGIHREAYSLVLAGLFLTWAIFLRPYLGLFLPIYGVFIFYEVTKFRFSQIKKALGSIFIFILPFVLVESLWIGRNYVSVNKLIILEDSPENSYGKAYPKCWLEIRKMIYAWGGEAAYFESGSEAWWFRRSTDQESKDFKFKQHIFENVSSYNRDSLVSLRALYREYLASADNQREAVLNEEVARKAHRYRSEFVDNNAFIYWVYKPLMGIKRLIFSSGSSYITLPPFRQMSLFQKIVKLFYSGLYYLILGLGIIGLTYGYLKGHHIFYAVVCFALILVLCGTIVFYSPIQEARYFIVAYPILLLFASAFIDFFLSRFRQVYGLKNEF